jgi:hypothetical protein
MTLAPRRRQVYGSLRDHGIVGDREHQYCSYEILHANLPPIGAKWSTSPKTSFGLAIKAGEDVKARPTSQF